MINKTYKSANCYLICGRSGSGKTTVVDTLSERYGLSVLSSYTTRPKRNESDKDHIYISEEEYISLPNKVATTIFNKNYYCATLEQINESSLYVIDINGIVALRKNYTGNKILIPIYIDVLMDECARRMEKRGDEEFKIAERLSHDYIAFKNAKRYVNEMINGNTSIEIVTNEVWNIIKKYEDWE